MRAAASVGQLWPRLPCSYQIPGIPTLENCTYCTALTTKRRAQPNGCVANGPCTSAFFLSKRKKYRYMFLLGREGEKSFHISVAKIVSNDFKRELSAISTSSEMFALSLPRNGAAQRCDVPQPTSVGQRRRRRRIRLPRQGRRAGSRYRCERRRELCRLGCRESAQSVAVGVEMPG